MVNVETLPQFLLGDAALLTATLIAIAGLPGLNLPVPASTATPMAPIETNGKRFLCPSPCLAAICTAVMETNTRLLQPDRQVHGGATMRTPGSTPMGFGLRRHRLSCCQWQTQLGRDTRLLLHQTPFASCRQPRGTEGQLLGDTTKESGCSNYAEYATHTVVFTTRREGVKRCPLGGRITRQYTGKSEDMSRWRSCIST